MGAIKHGDNVTGKRTKLYQVWVGMRARCNDPKHISYKNYGKRGIKVDPCWGTFPPFKEWSYANGYFDYEGPGRHPLEIDRIDSNGHYSPENCQWISVKENRRKQQATLVAFGDAKTLVEWSEDDRCQCPYFTLRTRLNRGWDIERAITTPNNRPGVWHQERRSK